MTITAEHIAALRTVLDGDAAAFERLAGQSGSAHGQEPDETATAYTQFILLRELVSDLDGDQLSALLAGARDDAERVGRFARPASR
jgi:hypothetical protein